MEGGAGPKSREAQQRRAARVVKLCNVDPRRVRLFAKKLGVPLPGGSGGDRDGVRNVCHALGVALSQLFRGEGSFGYPVRVAGSGVAGLAFFMDDGTVIKAVEVKGKGGGGFRGEPGLVHGGKAIPLGQFVHEIAMTRRAGKAFRDSFGVPRILRSVVLRGAKGVRVAVMQQSRAPGVTMAAFLRSAEVPAEVRHKAARMHGLAVAALHRKGWAHGDIHSENVMVDWRRGQAAPKLTVIDWGRANTLNAIRARAKEGQSAALWDKFLRYEKAFPYNDMMTHGPGRAFAESYLAGCCGKDDAAADKIRDDYHGIVNNNYMAMFQALDLVTRSLN
jgi:hypothetical protein